VSALEAETLLIVSSNAFNANLRPYDEAALMAREGTAHTDHPSASSAAAKSTASSAAAPTAASPVKSSAAAAAAAASSPVRAHIQRINAAAAADAAASASPDRLHIQGVNNAAASPSSPYSSTAAAAATASTHISPLPAVRPNHTSADEVGWCRLNFVLMVRGSGS